MSMDAIKTESFSKLNIAQTLKLPYTIQASPSDYSTLNEAFSVGEISSVPDQYPTIKYLMIGVGGSRVSAGASNRVAIDVLTHQPTDATLFEPVPFVLAPANDDLPALERARYRLRKLEVINGVSYWAYYLKIFSTSGVHIDSTIVTVLDGIIQTTEPYIPTNSRLSPIPVDLGNLSYNISNGQHLVTEAVVPVILSSADIDSIIAACIIKYGSIQYATISEVAIVSGYDVTDFIGPDNNGGSITYSEIRCAQVMSFISTLNPLQVHPGEITYNAAVAESNPYPPRMV